MSVLKQVEDGRAKARDAFAVHVKTCPDCNYGPLRLCAEGKQLCVEWTCMDAVVAATRTMENDR